MLLMLRVIVSTSDKCTFGVPFNVCTLDCIIVGISVCTVHDLLVLSYAYYVPPNTLYLVLCTLFDLYIASYICHVRL